MIIEGHVHIGTSVFFQMQADADLLVRPGLRRGQTARSTGRGRPRSVRYGVVLQYPACNVAKLDHAQVDDAQRRAIGWENATRLLGIIV